MLSVNQARTSIRAACKRLGTEEVAIEEAMDRVLALEVKACGDVPPFACSAMDGYAVVAGEADRILRVIGEARAGAPAQQMVRPEEAIRISTGAAVPEGCNAVIRQEDVADLGDRVSTQVSTPPGANVRQPGEDMVAGAVVLESGTRLGPAELGAAVAAGAGAVRVSRRPQVTILCTGDELRAPGEPLGPGEIHNSNGVMLKTLARQCGAEVVQDARLPDEMAATEAALAAALAASDVVLISGGVSVGPHDHVKAALERQGVSEAFWRVALQPGKPTWFGTRERTLVFGLPGNPVSALVTFVLFARPALASLQGARPQQGRPTAALGCAIPKNPQREQALRVYLEREDGRLLARPTGPQGSHILSSLLGADALAMIPAGEGELAAGTTVTLEPLHS